MHSNNPHQNGYDMQALAQALPELAPFIIHNKYDRLTINFSDTKAVKLLNKALLKLEYGLHDWDIPDGYLCPPIPGRVDYLYYLQDYLAQHHYFSVEQKAPKVVSALDIGTGANLIYPLLANRVFNWNMVASDIDDGALMSAQENINKNTALDMAINLRKQNSSKHIFKGVIQKDDFFHVTICNPPFHESQQAALEGSVRKNKNLNRNKQKRASNVKAISQSDQLNFSGQSNELWCEGGEKRFIKNMISESKMFSTQVGCFTCLVSKKETLAPIIQALKKASAQFDVIEMSQGNKVSRFIAWHFIND